MKPNHATVTSHRLVDILATVDDKAEQLLHLCLHRHHAEPGEEAGEKAGGEEAGEEVGENQEEKQNKKEEKKPEERSST